MMSFQMTPWVKRLLIANAAVFVLSLLFGLGATADLFAFSPSRLTTRPWGFLTYMFVHGGLFHLLFNLLCIFFFGPPLESRWGSAAFVKFYVVCGLGGALLSFAFSSASIIGASAACYGIMLAFAMIWPNAPVYIWGLVPVRVKWLVVFLVAISFASAIGPTRDGVAHLAHLGGAAAAFLLVKSGRMPQFGGNVGWGLGGLGGAGLGGAGMGRPGRAPRRPGRRSRGAGLRMGALRDMAPWRGRKRPRASSGLRVETERRRRSTPEGRGAGSAGGSGGGGPGRTSARPLSRRDASELDQVDAVLDKISAHGMDSLTAEERALLDRVSRRTRAN